MVRPEDDFCYSFGIASIFIITKSIERRNRRYEKCTVHCVFNLRWVVIGSLIANVTAGISFLSWLGYGLSLGITTPLVLDLGVITITFAMTFNMSVAVIICMVIAICIGRRFRPW